MILACDSTINSLVLDMHVLLTLPVANTSSVRCNEFCFPMSASVLLATPVSVALHPPPHEHMRWSNEEAVPKLVRSLFESRAGGVG